MDIIPCNRIKVFISSAMEMENGTAWLDVRRRIKKKLCSCLYINPFIIEDSASEISSGDFFTYQVMTSDIIILLFKQELRKGVEVEASIAKKYNKPMLIYFYSESNRELKMEVFRKDIEQKDYCTYKVFNKFDGLEDVIYDDLIQNVIMYYQYEHYKKATVSDISSSIPTDNVINTFPVVCEVKKMNIEIFKNCNGFLWNKFVFDEKQPSPVFENETDEFLYNFGNLILNFIIGQGQFPEEAGISRFLNLIKEYHGNKDWIIYRWDAIRYYNMGRFNEALNYAEKAKDNAQTNNAPDWLIDDILIDCRNIENKIGMLTKIYTFKYQKEINERESIIYLPVTDRFLQNAFEETINNFFQIDTNSPYTNQVGSNMKDALIKVENYIFSALIYGSNTHILISRDVLANIFYMYGVSFNDGNILFKALVFKLIAQQNKDFDRLISHYWNKLYINLTQNIKFLWSIACQANQSTRNSSMIQVYRVLGTYMSDSLFDEASKSIREIADSIDQYTLELLKAINNNLYRMNKIMVIEILNILLENKCITIFSEFCQILSNADFCGISSDNEIILKLEGLLNENIDNILENNGQIFFVRNLRKSFPDKFTYLEKVALEKEDETQRLTYDLYVFNSGVEKLLAHYVHMTKTQYDNNSKGGTISGFWYNPLKGIIGIMETSFDKNLMQDILINEFIPLCKNILVSSVPFSMKTNCIDALVATIQAFHENEIEYNWKGFCESILQEQTGLESGFSFSFFENNNPEIFKLKFILLKTICGFETEDEIMLKYFSLNRMDELERLTVARCIKQYIKCNHLTEEKHENIFIPIILNMSSDLYFEVRAVMCECFALLYNSKYKEIMRSKLLELMLDETYHIKNTILNITKSSKIDDEDLNRKILRHLSTDSCYNIRTKAMEIIKNLN